MSELDLSCSTIFYILCKDDNEEFQNSATVCIGGYLGYVFSVHLVIGSFLAFFSCENVSAENGVSMEFII